MKKTFLILICFLFITSCEKQSNDIHISKKPKPDIELIKSNFKNLDGWKKDDVKQARKSFMRSCGKLKFVKREFIYNSEIKIPTKEYQKLCLIAEKSTNFRKFIEHNFQPYLVKYKGSEQGKFTSYYEALLKASYEKTDKYKYPIYGKPNDLVELNISDFDKSLPSKRIVGRVIDNKLIPYHNREHIYNKGIDAPVILWSDSYVDIYVMQIQGSAVAQLENGEELRISYADNNGKDFKGIGSILLNKKLLPPASASMGKIKIWLKENIDSSVTHMNENERYIFHRISHESGPIGAQGVPLVAQRSLAVDNKFIPLGSMLWLETTGPNNKEIKQLVVAQDIGSAIKGGVRGDFFWGSGGDDILELAGKMNSTGKYFILLPKGTKINND